VLRINVLLVLTVLLVAASCSSNGSGKGYTIEGKINGLETGQAILLLQTDGDIDTVATVPIEAGAFQFEGKVDHASMHFIRFGDLPQAAPVFIENSAMTITAYVDSLPLMEVKGSPSHDDLMAYIDDMRAFDTKNMELQTQYQNLVMGASSGAMDTTGLMSQINGLIAELNANIEAKTQFQKQWPLDNLDKPAGAYAAWANRQAQIYSPEEVQDLSTKLSAAQPNSPYAGYIASYLAKINGTQIGATAPDFSLPDPSGKTVSLKDYRGKYVLIDFWAGWCSPCRAENPNLVAAYNQYKGRNFDVLGVSLDRERAYWEQAIAQDGLPWTQVSDLKWWRSDVAQLYGIESIPANFLLDPQGKIIARNLRGPALLAELESLLPAASQAE
jgi:peroxiredoxin